MTTSEGFPCAVTTLTVAISPGFRSAASSLLYTYDANGNRQTMNWNAIPSQYAYSANRLTTSSGIDNKAYSYDGAGRMTGDGIYTYAYDALGRLASLSQGNTPIATYRYNALGQRIAKDGNGSTSVPGSLTLLYDSFTGPDNRPIDDQDDKLWKGGGKKNTVAQVINGQAVIAEGKQIQSKSTFDEGNGLTYSVTLTRGRTGVFSPTGNLMVKYDGNKTITVNSDDSEDTEDPAKARFKTAQSGLPLHIEITVRQGKGRAKISSGTESFDSGEMPLPQNQSWRIRLAAVKVRKQALTGIMDDVSLKQTTTGQTVQSGRRFVYDESGHLTGEYDPSGKTIQELVWLEDLPVASIRPKASGTGTEIYYIHPDHLGTPRQITDTSNKIVWRWDTVEPFGNGLPDEDADGDGVRFEFNLRFPGQYYDKETGRHYNYFRDYDPAGGRYMQSDPIGLAGGINTYAYADNAPTMYADPFGLKTFMCTKPLHGLGPKWGPLLYPESKLNPLPTYHQFLCFKDGKYTPECGGMDRTGSALWSDGKPSVDSWPTKPEEGQCKQVDDRKCVDHCVLRKIRNLKRPGYGIGPQRDPGDCQEWADDALEQCQQECRGKK